MPIKSGKATRKTSQKSSSSEDVESSSEEKPKIKPRKVKKSSSSSEEEGPKIKPRKQDHSPEQKVKEKSIKNILTGTNNKGKGVSTLLLSDKELNKKQSEANNVDFKKKKFLQTKSAKKMSEIPKYVVTGLKVDILNSTLLKNISVGNSVIEPKEDKDGGINDPIAGALDENKDCISCGEDNLHCVGHMRYIQLPDELKLVPNIYLPNVAMILRCICKYCSGLLVTEVYMKQTNLLDYHGKDRLQKLAEECVKSSIRCQRYKGNMPGNFSPLIKDPTNKITKECLQNPIYRVNPNFIQCIDQGTKQKTKSSHRTMNEQGDQPTLLTMFDLVKIFGNVSPEDKVLMGFPYDHNFLDFIVDRLPIIPPNARPQIFRDGEAKMDHFTFATNKLVEEITNYNSKSSKDDLSRIAAMNAIYHYYNHMVDNTDESLKKGHKDVLKSVKHRLTGKDGAIRGFCMGKRVDKCMRTVAGPDSNLRFGEIGVPEMSRSELTVPETVTRYNIDKLQKMYNEGKIKTLTFGPDPRAEKLEGRSLRVNIVKDHIPKLAIGDKVDRFGEDGDVSLVGLPYIKKVYKVIEEIMDFLEL